MNPPKSLPLLRQRFVFLWAGLAFALTSQAAQAGSATWALDPDQFELWTNPSNWMPDTVPDGPNDTATFGVCSQHDSMPYHQIVDMICALQGASVAETKYRTITIPNSAEHAFEYWNSWDGISPGPTVLVKGDVLSFLAVYLKDCDDCP